MERDDVRVAQPAGRLGLAGEAQVGLALRVAAGAPEGEQLEGDRDAEQGVVGLVHAADGAAPESAPDREAPEAPGRKR